MNIIHVVRDVKLRVPGLPLRQFTTGEEVLPGSRYYFPLLWSGNATDSGIPDPGQEAESAAQPVLIDPASPPDKSALLFDTASQTWKPKLFSSEVAKATAQTRKRWRMGANAYTGPVLVAPDIPTLTLGAVGDGGTYNQQYDANALPGVVRAYGNPAVVGSNFAARTSQSGIATVTTYAFLTDADKFSIFTYAGGFVYDLYVDQKPYSANPITPAATTGFAPYGFDNFVFPSAKPQGRLIELRGIGGLAGLYVPKPFRVWKPPMLARPKITVVGDSFVAPTVMSDTSAGSASELYNNGVYQRMAPLLGTPYMVTDGIGGTGFLAPSAANMPYGHPTRLQWVIDRAPDVHIVHGGGANDLYNAANWSVAQIVAAAKQYFTDLRAALPDTKLVFVEGFAPPLAGFAENNADYVAIRTALQTELASVGVYYIDVATTLPVLSGAGHGWVTAVAGDGNSNIYVGSDAVHLTVKGNQYVRGYLAAKIARILADDGSLVNQLI